MALTVGILKETKLGERRSPLAPGDVRWLTEHGISILVESQPERIFSDETLASAGARIVEKATEADLLFGIKEPRIENLMSGKMYAIFSHTIKGQPDNMPLLAALLAKGTTLLDYECITSRHGVRLVYFGRFAGICGMVDSLCYLGDKLRFRGYPTPLTDLKPAHGYGSLAEIRRAVEGVAELIETRGLPGEMAPFIVGITGHGHVSQGAQEVLDWLNPVEVHPRRFAEFVQHERHMNTRVFKTVLLREEKFRAKERVGFYFEEYLEHPERFESNLDRYLPHLTMLVHTSYWDGRYPRLVTRKMIRDLVDGTRRLRLEFIGDLACDVKGSMEITERVTTIDSPTFTYDPRTDEFTDGHEADGISILAVDNLPSELPADASTEFSGQIRDYIYHLAAHGLEGGDEEAALPSELRRAFVTHRGRLTRRHEHLRKHLPAPGNLDCGPGSPPLWDMMQS